MKPIDLFLVLFSLWCWGGLLYVVLGWLSFR